MITIEKIREALENGNEKGYKLFPEVRDSRVIDILLNNTHGREMIEQIKSYSKEAIKEPSPNITFSMFKEFERTGNRIIFENCYFKRRKQLFTLVIAYIVEKDKKYIPLIEDKLWEWCDIYSWELPAHFSMTPGSRPDETVALFAAETAFFFAEILTIIGEGVHQFLVTRIKSEIFRRVINPFKVNKYWWESAKMNWSSVCAGSVGAAALYLIDDVDELSLIIERVVKSMDAFIQGFDKDGLITEGLSYWNYGLSFYVYFSELLRERTAGEISLLNGEEKIRKIAELPQVLQYPSREFVNFSDSGSGKWSGDCGLFSRLEEALDIKGYNYDESFNIYYDHTFRWPAMIRKLFWTTNLKDQHNSEIKTGSFYFGESQWLIDRRETKEGHFLAFAAKGGNNDEPHNHNDLGHFMVNFNGENIFVDIGSPEYVKQYFRNETRYNFIAAASLGHSVPVINNNAQAFGKEHYADVIGYETEASKTYFSLDLKKVYPCRELIKFTRDFIWDYENLQLDIKDKFGFDTNNNEIKEVFITKVKPGYVESGKILIESNESKAVLLFDHNLKCNIEECNYNDHSGKVSTVYRTVLSESISSASEYNFKIIFINK